MGVDGDTEGAPELRCSELYAKNSRQQTDQLCLKAQSGHRWLRDEPTELCRSCVPLRSRRSPSCSFSESSLF